MRLPRGELEQMGRRGRQWMARDFAAESVALRILAVYRWLIDGGEPPADIRLV